jgi:O-antigen ligase
LSKALWTGGGLIALAGLLVFGFGSYNPNPMRFTALLGLVVLLGFVWAWKPELPKDGLTWLVIVFFGYASLSLLWSYDWREGLLSLSVLFLLSCLFIAVRHLDRATLSTFIPIVATAAVLVSGALSVYVPGIYGGTGNENFQAEFLVLLIPLCAVGFGQKQGVREFGFIGIAAALVQLALNGSDAKWASALGVATLLILHLAVTAKKRLAFAIIAVGACAIWLKWNDAVGRSILQRLELTHNTAMMWADHPFFGAGIGSFNYLYPKYQEAHYALFGSQTMWGATLYAGAAHNEYVQFLAIFGLLGFGLLCGFCFLLIWKHRSLDTLGHCGLVAVAALGGLSLVGFPMQNASTAILGVVALGIVGQADRRARFRFHRIGGFGFVERPLDRRRTEIHASPTVGTNRLA